MSSILGALLGLAAVAVASPIANAVAVPTPAITEAPTGIIARQAAITTIPVSSCITFEDPDNGSSGCECTGYEGLLPYITTAASDAQCSYTDVVTGVSSANGYPFTTTLANSAIVAFATTTIYPGGSTADGVRDSTTIQAGTQVTLQMAPTSSVNVGVMTDPAQPSALYTAISNSLVAACPAPTSGQTVTSCSSVAAVTGVSYISSYNDLHTDGKLEINVELVSVTDADTLQMLIVSVAAGIMSNAQSPDNNAAASYECDSCYDDLPSDWPTINLTNVPAIYESIVSVQTEATNGAVQIQDLEVTLALEGGASAFSCSDASLVLSGMAALGAIIPGFGFLSLGAVGSVGRFGLSAGCDFTG